MVVLTKLGMSLCQWPQVASTLLCLVSLQMQSAFDLRTKLAVVTFAPGLLRVNLFGVHMQTLQAAMKDADVTTEQLDWLVLHQANQRILDAAAQRVGISSERVISNLAEYGNTSAASIPLAFDEAVRGGKIKSGDMVSCRSA